VNRGQVRGSDGLPGIGAIQRKTGEAATTGVGNGTPAAHERAIVVKPMQLPSEGFGIVLLAILAAAALWPPDA
jgi:hypothetical protein